MRYVVVLLAFCGVVGLTLLLVSAAGRVDVGARAPAAIPSAAQLSTATGRVNEWFRRAWAAEQIVAAEPADDLTVYRRLSLALHGTLPSLEEVRSFAADAGPDRVSRWTLKLLQDQRYCDYFAERLARSLVGTEEGPFILFRRDRLTAWLSDALRRDMAWTDMAAQLIAAEGLWTDSPAANFVTVARINEDEGLDENKLAGRTVRTFLGQRIDCAQCHDHPFDERWKQSDFEGLAAFFCQAEITVGGITDRPMIDGQPVVYRVTDPGASAEHGRLVEPNVPFHPEWLSADGSLRQRLAAWVVHPQNRRFERAIANRIWGLMFGRPYHSPVDDLPHPEEAAAAELLDILGAEFRTSGGRLSTLIRVIAESDVFRRSSASAALTEDDYQRQVQAWAVFPLVRLRPEQIIGSMIQAGSIRTIDQNSHPFIRFIRWTGENDFLKEFGDSGDDELLPQSGTIPQALLRMNGRFTRELTKSDGFSAAAQILRFSADDGAVVANCFLACLSRQPTPEELEFFKNRLADQSQSREQHVQDLYWALFNSPEFSWNH